MEAAPQLLDGARVLEAADVSASAEGLRPIKRLAIVAFAEESELYLFYCGEKWDVITYATHPTVAAAKERARFEYTGMALWWEKV